MDRQRLMRTPRLGVVCQLLCSSSLAAWLSLPLAHAQSSYLLQPGAPTFTTADPFESGYVNLANGVIHIEIPVASVSERGGHGFTVKLVYDSNIWHVVDNGVSTFWSPDNVSSAFGWRFVTSADSATVKYSSVHNTCATGFYNVNSSFYWSAPDGTRHYFPGQTQYDGGCGVGTVTTFTGYALDSSGYYVVVSNYTQAKVYAKDGTIVADSAQNLYTVKDPNGNFYSPTTDINGYATVADTLNRTLVTTTSVSSAQTVYNVMNSQGATNQLIINTATIAISTRFGQSGVTEYVAWPNLITSVNTPGGTYSFSYETAFFNQYGLLTSMTLPTGGQVNFSYSNFLDSYGSISRWVNTRASGGGMWTYTPATITSCASGAVGCQQKVTVTKPSGDETVYTFTLNNGAWNTQAASYTGPSAGGTLARTLSTDYDFSNACPAQSYCTAGAAYVRPIRVTGTMPASSGSISRKTEYSYDNILYGNISEIREYGYGSAAPDRVRDFTYNTNATYIAKNILNLVTSALVKDGAGSKVSETLTTYDSTPLTAVTGITHHDDTNYGAGNTARGNATLIQRWVGGGSYLSTANTFDSTGQLIKTTDPAGNSVTYSYADNFSSYTPAAPTNAYPTTAQLPLSGSLAFTYYFGTGQQASATDQNGNVTTYQYSGPYNRLTAINFAGGGSQTRSYTSSTQTDIYTSAGGQSRHDQLFLDGMARVNEMCMFNDPQGAVYAFQYYDAADRVSEVINPYRLTSDPTYGVQRFVYDGLDRVTQVTYPDNSVATTYYGAAVATGGGIATQLCSASTYGAGFPTLSVDQAGKKRQTWVDGLGRVIEVDEPDAANTLTLSTCYKYDLNDNLTEVDQGGETRIYTYDGLSRLTSETSPEEGPASVAAGTSTYSYTMAGGAPCSGSPQNVCLRTDARGITTAYSYDALNRLTSKTYSDATPPVSYFYDQSLSNGLTITNGKGRRTGMSDGSGQTAWSYNAKGQVLSERRTIAGVTKTISYQYWSDGALQALIYPSGHSVSYTYDEVARATEMDSDGGLNIFSYVSLAAYTPHGELSSASVLEGGYFPTGGVSASTYGPVTYTYNRRLWPTAIKVATSFSVSPPTLLDLSFAYLANGNVGTITNNRDTTRTQSFTYDNLNRIATAQSSATTGANCWGQSFGYDRYGNLTGVTTTQCTAPMLSLSVTNKNRIANPAFTYDDAGNLTADGMYSYTWDGENHLTSVNGVSYTYDGDGRRVKKSSGTLYWYGLKGEVLEETDLAGNWVYDYAYFNGQRVGRRDPAGNIASYFQDPLGSARVVAGPSGTLAESDYYPFGGERVVASTLAPGNKYQFTGMERDAESGLDHTLYRQYAWNLGRWLSPDPLHGAPANPQSWNRYAYVLNNPTNLIDPLGLDSAGCVDIANPDGSIYTFCEVVGSLGGPGAGGGGSGGPRHAPLQDNPERQTGGGGPGSREPAPPHFNPFILPGTNYCGPGDKGGAPTNGVDVACQQHDVCYANAGFSFRNGFPVVGNLGLSPQQKEAKAACDVKLCNANANTIVYSPDEAENQFLVGAAFGCIP